MNRRAFLATDSAAHAAPRARTPAAARPALGFAVAVAAAVAAAVAIGRPAPAHGSPMQLFGFGAASPAMAGAGVAAPEGFEALYLNPAGLAALPGNQLAVGGLAGSFDLSGADRPVEDARGLAIGLALRAPLRGRLSGRVGFGIGVYVPTAVLARVRAPAPDVPYFALLESRAQTLGVHVAAGVRISDNWSAGAGVLVLVGLRGQIDIASDPAGRIDATTEVGIITDAAPIAGATWRPRPWLRAGAAVRFPSDTAYDIDVASEFGADIPLDLPAIQLAGVAQYDPLTVALEVSLAPTERVTVTAQLAWERWSGFPAPTDNPIEDGPAAPSPGFHDTLVPRAAVAWRPRWGRRAPAVRAGYAFVASPAPEATGALALVDNHRHVIGAGAGAALADGFPVRLDGWVQVHALAPRRHGGVGETPGLDSAGAIYAGGVIASVELD